MTKIALFQLTVMGSSLSRRKQTSMSPVLDQEGGHSPERYADYKVIRRNGAVVGFEPDKIAVAVTKAFLAVAGGTAAASAGVREKVQMLTEAVVQALVRRHPMGGTFHIEDIQDQVELALMRGLKKQLIERQCQGLIEFIETTLFTLVNRIAGETQEYPTFHDGAEAQKVVDETPRFIDEFERLLAGNEILMARTQNIGLMSRELAIGAGVSGDGAAARWTTNVLSSGASRPTRRSSWRVPLLNASAFTTG